MNVEETFCISIPDEEAFTIVTVNDLFNIALNNVNQLHGRKCQTSSMFYKVRNSLIKVFYLKRSEIKTSSNLSALIPSENIRQNWQKLEQSLELKIPELERPEWNENILLLPSITFFILGIMSFGIVGTKQISFFILSLSYFYPASVARLTIKQKKIIPNHINQLSDFVYRLLTLNPEFTKRANKGWSRNEVFRLVQAIISEQVNLPIEKITGEASLVDDLGID